MQGRWRVQERSERSAQQMEQPVHDAHDEPYCRTITRIDHQKHAPASVPATEVRRTPSASSTQRDSDDNIGGRNGLGVVENVDDSKDAPIFNPLVAGEFPRVWSYAETSSTISPLLAPALSSSA
jgi:hypothetical protein